MQLTLGEKIKVAIDRSGFTQEEISKNLHIHAHTLRKILKGEGRVATLLDLMEYMNIEVDINLSKLKTKNN